MSKLFNLARMTTATTGTGTITLGSAVSGFLTFATAGAANGDIVSYGIKDGANSEVGIGTYTTTGTTLTRTVITSTNSNAAISLSGSAEVFITPSARDISITTATEQASTSGTSIDFTGIPDGVRRITIMMSGLSTNGTSVFLIQIGDSGGIETTGYVAGASVSTFFSTSTAGFPLYGTAPAAANTHFSVATLTLENISTNNWMICGTMSRNSDGATSMFAGAKATSAILDRVRITTVNGTDTFDAGAINITYEQ